jgi:YNFM family putative membrane transporter
MVLGPLLGGFLTQALSWRAAFALLAPLFAWLAIILLLRPPAVPVPTDERGQAAVPYFRQVALLLQSRWTRVVLLGAFVETGLGIAPMAFVPTVLHERFALSPVLGGGVAALFGIGGFLFSRTAAPLLLRVRPATMPAIGGAALAASLCLLAAMPHWSWATVACPLAGFGFFALHNTLQVRATQLSTTATGVAVSLFTCCIFIGQSVGVAIGAYTFTRFAPAWTFAIAAAGLLLLGLGLRRALAMQSAPATPLPSSEG